MWSERFRYETTESSDAPRSVVLGILARSRRPRTVGHAWRRVAEPLGRAMQILGRDGAPSRVVPARERARDIVFNTVVAAVVAFGAYEGAALHRDHARGGS